MSGSCILIFLQPKSLNERNRLILVGIGKLPELYLRLGDVDGAKKAVDILVKTADQIYKHDTNADDPNKAFKDVWPPTDLWRKAIQEAAKISPSLPEAIIDDVQDAEIAAFETGAFARLLLARKAGTIPFWCPTAEKMAPVIASRSERHR